MFNSDMIHPIFYNATLSDTEGGSIDLVPMKRRKNLIEFFAAHGREGGEF